VATQATNAEAGTGILRNCLAGRLTHHLIGWALRVKVPGPSGVVGEELEGGGGGATAGVRGGGLVEPIGGKTW
jgi:hypothetical protein